MSYRKWRTSFRDAYSEYLTWRNMRARCLFASHRDYPNYGGRGIRVCDQWSKSFDLFLEDMGRRPSDKHTLGRIDNDGPYNKHNCRWETQGQQQNNRRSNKKIKVGNEMLTLAQTERKLGLAIGTIKSRRHSGVPEKSWLALQPIRHHGESCASSKLTAAQVATIKQLYSLPRKKGDVTKMAKRLGVHRHTVQNIGNGSTWAN